MKVYVRLRRIFPWNFNDGKPLINSETDDGQKVWKGKMFLTSSRMYQNTPKTQKYDQFLRSCMHIYMHKMSWRITVQKNNTDYFELLLISQIVFC